MADGVHPASTVMLRRRRGLGLASTVTAMFSLAGTKTGSHAAGAHHKSTHPKTPCPKITFVQAGVARQVGYAPA